MPAEAGGGLGQEGDAGTSRGGIGARGAGGGTCRAAGGRRAAAGCALRGVADGGGVLRGPARAGVCRAWAAGEIPRRGVGRRREAGRPSAHDGAAAALRGGRGNCGAHARGVFTG